MVCYSVSPRGGFEFGDTGDKDSPEISLRRSVEGAGPVESVECEAKLFKGVARSCTGWFAEDRRGSGAFGGGNASASDAPVRRSAASSSAMRRKRCALISMRVSPKSPLSSKCLRSARSISTLPAWEAYSSAVMVTRWSDRAGLFGLFVTAGRGGEYIGFSI